MTTSRLMRSILAGAFGIALTIGLLYFNHVTLKQLADLFRHLNWLAFGGITICTFVYIALGGIKWHLIAGTSAPRPFFYLHYTAQSMLLGQFLPVPVAIAINRAAVMKLKQNSSIKKGLLNAVYDMGFDFIIAAAMVPASVLQLIYGLGFDVWLALSLAAIITTGLLLTEIPKFLPKKWRARLAQDHKRGLLEPKLIGYMIALSTIRFGITIIRLGFGATAIGIAVPYAHSCLRLAAIHDVRPACHHAGKPRYRRMELDLSSHPLGYTRSDRRIVWVSFRILMFFAQIIVSAICWALYKRAEIKK